MEDEYIDLSGLDLGSALGVEPEKEKATPQDQGGIRVSHRMGQGSFGEKRPQKRPWKTPCPGTSRRETATTASASGT